MTSSQNGPGERNYADEGLMARRGEFLKWVTETHNVDLPPHHDGFISTSGYGDQRLLGLWQSFNEDNPLAAWRALIVAGQLNLPVPPFVFDYFTTGFSRYLRGESLKSLFGAVAGKPGGQNKPANRYRKEYIHAEKCAAMLYADFMGKRGKGRKELAREILSIQRTYDGTGDESLRDVWKEIGKGINFGQIDQFEFVGILSSAFLVGERLCQRAECG